MKKTNKIMIVVVIVILLLCTISAKKIVENAKERKAKAEREIYYKILFLTSFSREFYFLDCDISELVVNTESFNDFYMLTSLAYAEFNTKDLEDSYSFSEEKILEILKDFKNADDESMDYLSAFKYAIRHDSVYFRSYYNFNTEVMINLEIMYYKDEDSLEYADHHELYMYISNNFEKMHPLEDLTREQIKAAINKTLNECGDKDE